MELFVASLEHELSGTEEKKLPMPSEKKWLKRLEQIVKDQLESGELNNKDLANQIEISERQLFRRVKELTGLSPQKYIRQYRLYLALKYLENGIYKTVKETASAIGYTNTSYFINQFEKHFGKKPLAVLREAGWR